MKPKKSASPKPSAIEPSASRRKKSNRSASALSVRADPCVAPVLPNTPGRTRQAVSGKIAPVTVPSSLALSIDKSEAAYHRFEGQMLALASGELTQLSVDIPTAVSLAIASLSGIRSLRPQLEKTFTKFDFTTFDALEDYALATWFAHSVYASNVDGDAVPATYSEALTIRDTMLSDARALAKRRLIDGRRLDGLSGLVGFKNVANDVMTMTTVLSDSWPEIASKTALTAAEVERARTIATELLGGAGARRRVPAGVGSPSDMRQRAFTLFAKAYDEARAAIVYVRRNDGDADSIAPSLYSGRAKRGKSEPPVSTEPTPPAAPMNGNAASVTAAPTQATASEDATQVPRMTTILPPAIGALTEPSTEAKKQNGGAAA